MTLGKYLEYFAYGKSPFFLMTRTRQRGIYIDRVEKITGLQFKGDCNKEREEKIATTHTPTAPAHGPSWKKARTEPAAAKRDRSPLG